MIVVRYSIDGIGGIGGIERKKRLFSLVIDASMRLSLAMP
ncbi:8369_t:CDS:2 [Cetraspora pellucida]|uniref:8369_t:CDS:1 n=1 Tax=Cetraspora pellucida TaxID=1433469 RepID=A0ACA9KZM7_9GLOM|nr:8369_t:CDS:2 [Cetraspora pellucida]